MTTIEAPKPEHFCADHDWALLLPGDPRMVECQCTFTRDAEERAREVWRAGPGPHVPGQWALRYGGATVGTDDRGRINYVRIDEVPFEGTITRDLVTHMPYIVEAYVHTYRVDQFTGSTMMHFLQYAATTANARLHGQRYKRGNT